jgi:hypothetical protein
MRNFSWRNFELVFEDRRIAIGYEVKRPGCPTIVRVNFTWKLPIEGKTLNTIEEALNIKGVTSFRWFPPIAWDISKDGTFYKYHAAPDQDITIPVQLTRRETFLYQLLKHNKAMPKTILLEWFKTNSAVESQVSRLRKKIKPLGEHIRFKEKTYILAKTEK